MRFLVRLAVEVLTFASLLLSIRLTSQNAPGAIDGTVVDTAGSSLVGAKIVIQPTGRKVASDDQGQFRGPCSGQNAP